MNKTQKQQRKFAQELIESLIGVFEDSYKQRRRGATEAQLLIQHDIFAANAEAQKTKTCITVAHRRAMQSAIEAADARVPMRLASSIMRMHLNESADELIKRTAS